MIPSPPAEPAGPPRAYQDTDLVSLRELDADLVIALPLAGEDNPFGFPFYRRNEAYLRYGTARKLLAAQREFSRAGLRLKIWDAYRPFAAQVKMFYAAGRNPDWVSDPWRASGKKTHVRGVAVDCTLVDREGRELAMPTPYLDFEHGAERMKHSYTRLPAEVLANRRLLRETMERHGLEAYPGEWWHYQDAAWERYPVLRMKDLPELHATLLAPELLGEEYDEER